VTFRDQPPRAALERLVDPPRRLRDRILDAHEAEEIPSPSPRPDAVDVVCWTPLGGARRSTRCDADGGGDEGENPLATLLADPSIPGDIDGVVAHTLVLDVDGPVRSITVDYGSLDAAATPDHDVRVRTEADRTLDAGWRVTAEGGLVVRFADPPAADALFVEYGVTRNPAGGRHTVDVVLDDERTVEARLVVLG
jgi:hypothetical protein